MSSKRLLSTLDIAPGVLDLLLKRNFQFSDEIVNIKPFDLSKELRITAIEANQIIATVRSALSENQRLANVGVAISALEMCQKASSLRPIITFCKSLDKLLGGGVQIGQITEFCGVPGIGKTQLGIQLALDVQIPEIFTGNGGECVYIDTEGSFMVERVMEMAQSLSEHLMKIAIKAIKNSKSDVDTSNFQSVAAKMTPERLLQGIHVFRVHNQTEQIAVINSLSAFLQTHTTIKLIIIDSIAFHFRQELQELSNRGRMLSTLAQTLNQLAYDKNLAIVTINHITTRVTGQGTKIIPALGEQWSHCIANRVMMFWQQNDTRTACLIKAPSRPQGFVQYSVTPQGIRDCQILSTSNSVTSTQSNVLSQHTNTSAHSSNTNVVTPISNDMKRQRVV